MYSKGNPLTIGNDITMTWQNGRELATYKDTSKNLSASYKYNDDGIRIEKNINNTITKYYLEGTNIIFEDRNGTIIYYNYDASGVAGFEYNNNTYYFVKNLQGDVISILDSNYSVVANYEYDSWGNPINITDGSGVDVSSNHSHIANINPFRYRSYYFDVETSLYYLNSRYYSPEFGRFINSDMVLSNTELLGYNLYAYVSNNPVNFSDPSGMFRISMIIPNNFTELLKKGAQQYINAKKEQSTPGTVKYNVPSYSQGDTNLCWAYSQVMMEDYKAGITRTQEQADQRAKEIAVSVNGKNNWNRGGWPTNMVEGGYIIIGDISGLVDLLKDNGPLYGVFQGETGHMVVITGASITGTVYLNDPGRGRSFEMEFDQFIYGPPGSAYPMPFKAVYLAK